MKTINNFSLGTSYVQRGPYHTIEEASGVLDAFYKVASLGQKTRVARLYKSDLYYVESLTIDNEEYKNNEDFCTKEEAIQLLAGISKAFSQIKGQRSSGS